MPPDLSQSITKSKLAEPPFPWRCSRCGRMEVNPARVDYPARVKYDGRLVSFTAQGIEVPTCRNCGQKVVTLQVDDAINVALYAHLGLLTPQQIRDGIERLALTQKEVAERLGIAEATLSRWVNKCVIQSRAMDNLLRLFFQIPEVRTALSAPAVESTLDVISTPNAVS